MAKKNKNTKRRTRGLPDIQVNMRYPVRTRRSFVGHRGRNQTTISCGSS